jgi:hypothetical protein
VSVMVHRSSFFQAILLSILLGGAMLMAGASGTRAQPSVETVSVALDEVVSDFPQGLTFQLELADESTITRADLLFSIGEHPTLIQTSATPSEVSGNTVEHFVDLLYLQVPTGVTLTYQWRLQLAEDLVVETPAGQAEWIDDRFDWTVYETDDVQVHAYAGDDEFYDLAVQVAQTTVDDLQQRFDAPPRPERLRIWLYESASDLSGAMSPNSRDWIGGVSYARYSLVAAVVPSGSEYSIQRVIPHEVAHQIIHDATLNPFIYPATWLDEGIAMTVQTVDQDGLDERVEEAYLAGTLPTVQSLISEFGSDGESTRLSYASSYSIVRFLEETRGAESIADLVSAYAEGHSHDETLLAVLAIDTAELDRLWRDHIENQITA